MTLDLIKDSYDRKARLYPALLVVLPIAALVGVLTSMKLSALEGAAATIGSCGGAFLITQLVRDSGKRKEVRLFRDWGVIPSVSILRHRDARVDPITKRRHHERLVRLVQGTLAPSSDDETENPTAADHVYSSWCAYLRSKTRNTKDFGLLFRENISYGFRRNLLGMRPFGIASSAFSFVVAVFGAYAGFRLHGYVQKEIGFVALASSVLLMMWLFIVSPDWVRLPADAYAERLLESVENLKPDTQAD
jgi:hypothetical protein